MGDSSDSDNSSDTVDGEDVGERSGSGVRVEVDIAPESKDTNSDEELLNI